VPWGVPTFPRLVYARGSSFRGYFIKTLEGADLDMRLKIDIDDFRRCLAAWRLL
jgi:hypothetical protein